MQRFFWRAAAAAWLPAIFVSALDAGAQLRYEREYPSIPYSSGAPTDPVARLWEQVTAGRVVLAREGERGYLDALLGALAVPPESQTLVFTRTSLQKPLITPSTPRAIYFSDDVYVAWIPGTAMIEVATVDPLLGAVFYTVSQESVARPPLQREMQLCLSCHDTFGLTGGGVPELLVGGMLPNERGEAVFHEGWFRTTPRTPLARRWGGWYVTGTHGDQVHQGNVFVRDAAQALRLDFRESGNVTDLSHHLDTNPYPTGHSDIVALMVLEHQIQAQNLVIRLNYRLRTALHEAGLPPDALGPEASLPPRVAEALAGAGEPLVEALLFSGEAPLSAPVRGTSGFAEHFAARGPRDGQGRSLRAFDLERRLFRHPLSYLVYSEAFDGLPAIGRAYVYRRLREVLLGQDRSEPFRHLSEADRWATLEILTATKSEFRDRTLGD